MAKKYVKSRPGLFGMVYYYDESGKAIGKSRPGLIDGTRVYTDQNSGYIGKSRNGLLSKSVYKDTDTHYITSYDSFCGEVHFRNGAPIGNSSPGWFGASYTALEAEEEIYDDILYEDATVRVEEEVEEYEESSPQTTVCTVGGKVKCLVLLLALCALIVYMCSSCHG